MTIGEAIDLGLMPEMKDAKTEAERKKIQLFWELVEMFPFLKDSELVLNSELN